MNLFLTITLILACGPSKPSPLVEEVVETSVALREDGKAFGSGVIINHKNTTYVLTAAHCCAHLYTTEVKTYTDKDGNTVEFKRRVTKQLEVVSKRGKVESARKATLVWYDKETDLALLTIDARGLRAAKVPEKAEELELGELAWACGSGVGVEWNLVRTSIAKVEDDYITTNGKGLFFGHSGSGLFVKRGKGYRLAGLVVQGHYPYATFVESVPLAKILAFLKDYDAYQAQNVEAGPNPREER